MGFKKLDEIVAFQFAQEFKEEVYTLIERSAGARRDLKFRSQLEDAVSSIERQIAEGFGRRNPSEFANFLRYGLASLQEALTTLFDGIRRGFFAESACERALTWGRRCKTTMESLRRSQLRLAARDRKARKSRARRPPRRKPSAR